MNTIWLVTSLRSGEWQGYWPAAPLAIWAIILISYAVWPERGNHATTDATTDTADAVDLRAVDAGRR